MQRGLNASFHRAGQGTLYLGPILLFVVIIFATGIGSVSIAPLEVIRSVWHGLSGQLASTQDVIIWQLRLPRVLLAALVGMALALSGVAFQGVFRNPLADPYLLGVASGASFGATLAMLLGSSLAFLAGFGVPLFAFIFALLAVFLVLMFARQGQRMPMVTLILAGVVISSSLTAATSFLMLLAREQAPGILAWLLGSFALASWTKVLTLLPFVLLGWLFLAASSRALNLLQLGEEQAAQLGLPVEGFKLAIISLATLVTALAVSVSGIIGFVGLMVPHAVRLARGANHQQLMPLAAILGAIFMVLADLLARTLISPAEMPIGVITALVGGPFFLYLLRSDKRLVW